MTKPASLADLATIVDANEIRPLVADTAKSATSTVVDFTLIPSWARRITVMFDGVSTNGSSNPIIQLGTSSGIETSNYRGSTFYPGATYSVMSSGFMLSAGNAANILWCGSVIITLLGSNTWTEQGIISHSGSAALGFSSGAKTLAGTLDRVRITTVNGTDVFDAGTINILYE